MVVLLLTVDSFFFFFCDTEFREGCNVPKNCHFKMQKKK